jgi:hypothetical protein
LGTLANETVLSAIGPAIPITITVGKISTFYKNSMIAFSKISYFSQR